MSAPFSNYEPADTHLCDWLDIYRVALESAYDSILITDAQLDRPGPRIVYANPAFQQMTGYSLDEVGGATPRILQGEATDRSVLDELRRSLERGQPFEGSVVNYRRDGTPFDVEWRTTPMRDAAGVIRAYVAVQRDVTAHNRMLQQLREQADRDWLTAAYNRRRAQRALEREIERARRYGIAISVLLIDIDRFKSVNDRHGHLAGDEVLKRLSQRIGHRLRSNDLFARWGGEEFLVVLPHTDLATAATVAASIQEHIHTMDFPDAIRISVSMGVTAWCAGDSVDGLIDRADRALYRAKSSGRARIEVEPP